jgi:SAM-dependent methyltransferase
MADERLAGSADAGVIGPAAADEAARSLARLLPPSLGAVFGAAFIRSDRLYDEFITRLAVTIVRDTGLEKAAQESGTATELALRAGLDGERSMIPVDWLLRRLAARGHLERIPGDPPRFRATAALPGLDAGAIRDEQLRQDPSWLPSYVLAETVARDYPHFLRGEKTGEDVLFSPARLRLWVEFFSNDNGYYAVNNRVGAVAAAEWLPPGPVTMLEVGGGLGSAAIALLARLHDSGRTQDIAEYRFTDVVPVFLRRGQQALEKRFAGVPFLRFATLDMNRPLREQGIAPGASTMIYAVNTLHVARDLDFTLGELREALGPGGALVISECVRLIPGDTVNAEFVFNLLESFRAPVLHPTYRPNGGFLTPEQWRSAMEAAGFADVKFLPDIDRIRGAFPNFSVLAIGATRR